MLCEPIFRITERCTHKVGKKEAAEYLGLNLRTYQYYEEGRSEPSILRLVKLADFFMVSLDELVGRDWIGR